MLFQTGLCLCCGCGYHFSGRQAAPFGIHTIAVLMFENRTSETGVESVLANDLISEVTRDGRMKLARPEQADAVITGVVTAADIQTISREKGYAASERRVEISVNVQLTGRDEKLHWTEKNVKASESFLVTEDKLATAYNRKLAVAEVSKKIAQAIYLQMGQNF